MADLKRCSRCKETKPLGDFHSHRTRGAQSYCKPCQLTYHDEYQKLHADRLRVKREHARLMAETGALVGSKPCKVCGVEKPLLEFYVHRDTKDRRATHCKDCQRQRARERRAAGLGVRTHAENAAYYAAHKSASSRASREWRIRQYGLTVDQYDEMLSAQGGRCLICGETGEDTGRPLGIDHCHDTSVVRGLLCNFCNSLLGFARDNEAILLRAVDYLRASRREEVAS